MTVDRGDRKRIAQSEVIEFVDVHRHLAEGIAFVDGEHNGLAGAQEQPAAAAYYTVVPGDSLWKIALRQYGSGEAWRRIYEENRAVIANPALICAGQQLRLPAAQ